MVKDPSMLNSVGVPLLLTLECPYLRILCHSALQGIGYFKGITRKELDIEADLLCDTSVAKLVHSGTF